MHRIGRYAFFTALSLLWSILIWAPISAQSTAKIEIGLWFSPDQVAQLKQDSARIQTLLGSDINIIAWEGPSDDMVKGMMSRKSITWFPVVPNGYFRHLKSEEEAQFALSELNAFKEMWVTSISVYGGVLGGLIGSAYPFLEDPFTEEFFASALEQDPDLLVLIRPGQLANSSRMGRTWMTCLEDDATNCREFDIDLSRTPTSGELLRQLEFFAERPSTEERNLLMINGTQWLDIVQSNPDYRVLIQDLREGRKTVFPSLRNADQTSTPAFYSLQNLLGLFFLIGYFLLIRSSGYYLQRLYRYFINFGYTELEISSRKDHSTLESLGYFLLGNLVVALLLNILLQTHLSPVGIEAIQSAVPFFSVGEVGAINTLSFSLFVVLSLEFMLCIWLWFSYSKMISFGLILRTCSWPLHLLLLPLIMLLSTPVMNPPDLVEGLWLTGGVLLLGLWFLISINLNLYQVPRRKKPVWLVFGIAGWLVFSMSLIVLTLHYSGLLNWVEFSLRL